MPLTPKNRKEEWLEGLVDHETTLTPKNRCEAWMKEIIDASGGSGGGGGGGVLVVNTASGEATVTMDKTYAEIKSAFMNGLVICILSAYDGHSMLLVTYVYDDEEECDVDVFGAKDNLSWEFTCSSVNDYPTYTE